jgi:diadenosine tetraphosphatase ApaH/serine/threonine PP2A family protein phosphatase
MKYAIISDIHANLEALQAVLADARPRVDTIICLGDIVGYNANPNECLQLVQNTCHLTIVGNHDLAATGSRPYDNFNEYAKEAMDWTRMQLTPAGQAYLQKLPLMARFGTCWLAAHGSPRDTDEYLLYTRQFRESFAHLQQQMPEVRCCFVGHTHLPMIWHCTPDGGVSPVPMPSLTVTLDSTSRYIVNPGSVGQPRCGNPDASYVVLDDGALTVEFRFVPYDVHTTQEKIYDAGLPTYLAERLAEGL